MAKNEYLMIHDKVCTHLQYSVCKALGIKKIDKWYMHTRARARIHTHTHTHTEGRVNRPDIMIKTKKRKHAY